MKKNILLFIFSAILLSSATIAAVEINAIFGDNMVVQRNLPVKIFGTGDSGELVKVSFAEQIETTAVDHQGNWHVTLEPMQANPEPQQLKVNGINIENILVGDVWMCTGQSNMAGMLRSYISYGDGLFKEFKNEPGNYRNEEIRLFTVGSLASDKPESEVEPGNGWQVCNPESAPDFSCTGYFFGKYLQPEAGVPVGLIKSAIGGTGIVSWLPLETMRENPTAFRIYLQPYLQQLEKYPDAYDRYLQAKQTYDQKKAAGEKVGRAPQPPMGPDHPKRPAAYYNGMIHPLHNFTIKGAIWYQGEHEGNRGVGEEYKTTFPLMIETWRNRWDQGDVPFVFVQLAAFREPKEIPSDSQWARLREAQLYTSQTVPNTGMAVAIDAGLTKNIHPPYKELVGERLAAEALRVAYDRDIVSHGPIYRSMKLRGRKAILQFDGVGSGLVTKKRHIDPYGPSSFMLSGDQLHGFTIAGPDRVFHPAAASIKGKTVVVQSERVSNPVAVRYAWADFPLCNLYNDADFPASPFRTDDWSAED